MRYVVASICSRNHLISEKYKTVNHSSHISFKIFALCNYTLLPATVKVLETFLEAMLWKSFQLFHHILNDVTSIMKAPSLKCWYKSREQVKIKCSHVMRVRGCSSVVTMFFTEKFLTKTIRCAGAFVKESPTIGSPFFGEFPSDRIPKAIKGIFLY